MTAWSKCWTEIEKALDSYESSQARTLTKLLGSIRLAIREYGHAVDPDSFDEYGQPRESP